MGDENERAEVQRTTKRSCGRFAFGCVMVLVVAIVAGGWALKRIRYERTKHLSRDLGYTLIASPDGELAAFTMAVSGMAGLFVIDVVTGELTPIHWGLGDSVAGDWTSDGERFAYGNYAGVWIWDRADGNVRPVCAEQGWYLSWSESGRYLGINLIDRLPFGRAPVFDTETAELSYPPASNEVYAWAGETLITCVGGPPPMTLGRLEVPDMAWHELWHRDGAPGSRVSSHDPRGRDLPIGGRAAFVVSHDSWSDMALDAKLCIEAVDTETGEASEAELDLRRMDSLVDLSPSPDGRWLVLLYYGLDAMPGGSASADAETWALILEHDAEARTLEPQRSVSIGRDYGIYGLDVDWSPSGSSALLQTSAMVFHLDVEAGTTTPLGGFVAGSGRPRYDWLDDQHFIAAIEEEDEAGLYIVERATRRRECILKSRPSAPPEPSFFSRVFGD